MEESKMKIAKKALSLLLSVVLMLAVVPFPTSAAFSTEPMVSAGTDFTLALKEDGTVWAWGSNSWGQMATGKPTYQNETTPVQIKSLSGIVLITAGESFSYALRADGTVWMWGGYETKVDESWVQILIPPEKIDGLTDVVGIVPTGGRSAVFLKKDGTVWTWDKEWGASGVPIQVTGLSGVAAIYGGSGYAFARKKDGTVWAWGNNGCGQLGDGTTTDRTTPVQVKNIDNVVDIATGTAGSYNKGKYTIAVKKDGTLWIWGGYEYDDSDEGSAIQKTPVQFKGLSNVRSVATGKGWSAQPFVIALKKDGTVWAWGENKQGQLGDGTTAWRGNPVQVKALNNITAVSSGIIHTVALKKDGTVWAWGYNGSGRLGNGKQAQFINESQTTPVQVKAPGGNGYLNLKASIYVSMRIGKTKAIQNGILTTIDSKDAKPFKVGGRTMIPVRFIGEKMGGKVTYTSNKAPIYVRYGDITAELKINGKTMKVTQGKTTKPITLDVAATLRGGRVYLPLRAVGEALGFDVKYQVISGGEYIVVGNPKMSSAVLSARLKEAQAFIK